MKPVVSWLRQEPALKLVSLLLAVGLWAWRSSEGNPLELRHFPSIPVKVENLAKGLVVVSEAPSSDIWLFGPRRTLDQMQTEGKPQPVVDCSGIDRPSWPSLPIEIATPENVELRRVEPKEWEVEIDAYETDVKPIRADVGNTSPPQGYIYEPPQPGREQAQVSGPRKLVNRVAYVKAEVDLSERMTDYPGQARLRPVDSSGQVVQGVDCEPRLVDVAVRVLRIEETRVVRVTVPIEDRPAAGHRLKGYEATPPTVTVKGTRKGLDQLGERILTAPVDVAGKRASFARDVPLVPPHGVVAVPGTVRVRVTIVPATTR